MDEQLEFLLKVVMVGDSGVGKTNLLSRYSRNLFEENTKNTIGVDFSALDLVVNKKAVKVQFWDTAGQEKYRAIASAYYKNAHGAIIVYDITNRASFDNVENWLHELRQHGEANMHILLLGNKIDIESSRQVAFEDGEKFGQDNGIFFLEVSAKTNENDQVKTAFTMLITEIFKRVEKEEATKMENEYSSMISTRKLEIAGKVEPKGSSCC